jgi:hypothetical protein
MRCCLAAGNSALSLINACAVILAQRDSKHESDDGGPYRKAGESIDACLARYGIDPRRQCCILLNLTGFP